MPLVTHEVPHIAPGMIHPVPEYQFIVGLYLKDVLGIIVENEKECRDLKFL